MHTPDGTAAGQQATYECKLGYVLSELVTRICGADGFWTDEAPCCDPGKSYRQVLLNNKNYNFPMNSQSLTARYLKRNTEGPYTQQQS